MEFNFLTVDDTVLPIGVSDRAFEGAWPAHVSRLKAARCLPIFKQTRKLGGKGLCVASVRIGPSPARLAWQTGSWRGRRPDIQVGRNPYNRKF